MNELDNVIVSESGRKTVVAGLTELVNEFDERFRALDAVADSSDMTPSTGLVGFAKRIRKTLTDQATQIAILQNRVKKLEDDAKLRVNVQA